MDFHGTELFLDDELIAYTRNVRRELQSPEMCGSGPIIRREYPWEASHATCYGSVLFDDERDVFRMWYNAYGEDYYNRQALVYAESPDGVHWTKPMLDVCAWPGYERTNLFGTACNVHGPCVVRNPDPEDRERRYLMLFDSYAKWRPDAERLGIRGRWCYTAESSDGLRWSPPTGRPAFAGKADSGQSVVWDPDSRSFKAYVRLTTEDAFGQRIRIWRLVESPDFVTWGEPRELRPDAQDGAPDTQLQQLAVTRYEGIYIGLMSLFRIRQCVRTEEGHVDEGPQVDTTQLVTSRDGVHFTRVAERAAFLCPSARGAWGETGFRLSSHLLPHGDRILIYCASRGGDAGDAFAVGLFTLARDRFVALLPARLQDEALVELVPLRYPQGGLRVNAAVGAHGVLRCELATFEGEKIQGFTRAEAVPITGDAPDHAAVWQAGGRTYSLAALPPGLRDRPIRLRLWPTQARLHALRA